MPYIFRPDPAEWINESETPVTASVVWSADRAPTWTGLYTADGTKVYRTPEPMGFQRPLTRRTR